MHSLAEQSGTVLRQEPILCKDGCADEKKKIRQPSMSKEVNFLALTDWSGLHSSW